MIKVNNWIHKIKRRLVNDIFIIICVFSIVLFYTIKKNSYIKILTY
jgi:hypothetical protein